MDNVVTKELFAELVKRVDRHELAIENLKIQDNSLAVKQGEMDVKLDNISKLLVELKEDIKKLSDRPTKRYDNIVNAFIGGIITIIGGVAIYFATKH